MLPAPTYSFAADPTSISAGTSSTLKWRVEDASTVTLDGQPVASSGTKVVTPTQTTSYNLHIVFLDGSTKDVSATVTLSTAPPPPGLEWDSRLDGLGIKLTRTNAAHAWRLVAAKYQPPEESMGKQHVLFNALRADGTPAANV